MSAPRKVWNIDGELLEFEQIHARLGADIPRERLKKRLRLGWRTWQLLNAGSRLEPQRPALKDVTTTLLGAADQSRPLRWSL